jgi:hypothetical protein
MVTQQASISLTIHEQSCKNILLFFGKDVLNEWQFNP